MLLVRISRIRPDKESACVRGSQSSAPVRTKCVRRFWMRPCAPSRPTSLRRHGPLLIYVIEAEDPERGAQAYATSRHKIDAEHKEVMRECLAEPLQLVPLYDLKL